MWNRLRRAKEFPAGFHAMEPLGDCVLCVTILDSSSRMYLCEPWDGLWVWANQVNDRHLPYIDTGMQAHFAGLNICISGRCEVCPLDSAYVYMEPGMLCIDEHTPKDGYWYPGRSYTGLEIVFDLDRLSQNPIPELSAYCDYDGWVRRALENHGGLYLGAVGAECGRLTEQLYSHLEAADWSLEQYRLHLLLLLYTMVNGGEAPVRDRAYVTKGQKAIADDVERRITEDLSRHESIPHLAQQHGISPSALKKYFEAVYGQPISFYLRGKRMDFARQRLAQTKDSVGSIAAGCGYASQGKFGAVFRECTGMSPLEYRRWSYRKTEAGHEPGGGGTSNEFE